MSGNTTNDADGDTVCGDVDNCAAIFNPGQVDSDLDGRGNLCDNCEQVRNGPCASNPLSTQDDVCAALAERGVRVFATHDPSDEDFERYLHQTIETGPDIIVDDGAELVGRLIDSHPDLVDNVIGASEETTTGIMKLTAMTGEGVLPFPVLAANDAKMKHLFDNRYGTGISSIAAILSNTNLFLSGKAVVVMGFGWVSRGLAKYADGMGARVIVCEPDPVKLLEAYSEGYQVMNSLQAAEVGDVFITGTGNIKVLGTKHFERMKDGALLANAALFHGRAQEDTCGAGHFGTIMIPLLTALVEARGAPLQRLPGALIAGFVSVVTFLAFALGADMVSVGREAMLSIGCIQATEGVQLILGTGTPLVGRLLRGLDEARFTGTLGTLVSAGVNLVDALRVAEERGKEVDRNRDPRPGGVPPDGVFEHLVDALRMGGPLTHELLARAGERAQLLHRHQILVAPSRYREPFGTVALEGIACGCAVVGSADGGLVDAIGPCGRTFPNGDAAALAQVLADLLRDPEQIRALLRRAPEHLAFQTGERIARMYADVFAQAREKARR